MRRLDKGMNFFAKAVLPALAIAAFTAKARAADTEIHGVGWVQIGRVENSYALPNAINDYNGNWLGNSGGIVSITTKVDENWEGGLGLGTALVHLARGSRNSAKLWYPFWVPFIPEARFTYSSSGFADRGGLQVTVGSFIYDYNPDVKNLGLYLLRGYVYPGTLISGFETKHVIPAASLFGAMGSYKFGGVRNDLILNSELEDRPFFDFSLADVLTLRLRPGVEIGAGVNLYRVLPANGKATSPGRDCDPSKLGIYSKQGQENPCFIIEKDAAGNPVDTVTGSFAGTKLMARFRLDPKAILGVTGGLGKEDGVLYGEAAILGVKNYPVYYDDILRRIPVMVGFNVPTFGFMNLSAEVEYYASKNSSDNLGPQNGSWLPAIDSSVNNRRDDWKWSVYASKVFMDHMKLSGQVANDHLRLGGSHNDASGVEAMRRPVDWYWAAKLAYFF
jgi:hypothetical protein